MLILYVVFCDAKGCFVVVCGSCGVVLFGLKSEGREQTCCGSVHVKVSGYESRNRAPSPSGRASPQIKQTTASVK